MSDAWESYPRAPSRGTPLAASSALAEGDTLSLNLDGFPVLLLRGPTGLRGFVNACPHQFLPLDYRSDSILAGAVLRCSNHDAGFDADTGDGLDGLALGCNLDPIPLTETGDQISIAS